MATEAKAPKAPKAPKDPVSLPQRVIAQLNRAVLARKVTKTELRQLSEHIQRLDAFVE